MSLGWIWRTIYRKWHCSPDEPTPGYSLLLVIPGDLPVFLDIAIRTSGGQRVDRLNETIVVPDNFTREFAERFQNLALNWKNGPIYLEPLNWIERGVVRWLNNPDANCWLQFKKGCNSAKSRHLLWHDADLLLLDPDFFEEHYQSCIDGNYCCFGVNESWDSWYRDNGFSHVTSTWEILLDLPWVRNFAPWQHRGHDGAKEASHL